MKTYLLLFFFVIPVTLPAQECNAALFMNEGASLTYTDYSRKGKPLKTAIYETVQVTYKQKQATALIKATLTDLKEKETYTLKHKVFCENGNFSVDMLRFFDTGKLSEYKDMELVIDGDVLSFPDSMRPGDLLDDGTITIKIKNNAFTMVTMSFRIYNRTVHSDETISTPAGTFVCQKVTFDFDSKFGIIKLRGSGTEWYDKDKVVVKSESYNKKGKLIGYHELTAIN